MTSCLPKVSDPIKQMIVTLACPLLSSLIWEKMKRAEYEGKRDPKIASKVFSLIFNESEGTILPTRLTSLLKELLMAKRERFPHPIHLRLNSDFTVDFSRCALYSLVGSADVEDEDGETVARYVSIRHVVSGREDPCEKPYFKNVAFGPRA